MNRWLSRTFWMISGILITASFFLWLGKIVEATWLSVITTVSLYWVGNDVVNKYTEKKKE
jgi:hypothetical protein